MKARGRVPTPEDGVANGAVGGPGDAGSTPDGNDSLASVLATVAHQMSQPLTALRGTLELTLLKGRSAADHRRAAGKALASAERLAVIVQSVRELADACSPPGELEMISLDLLGQAVAEDMAPVAEARGVKVDCSESSPAVVRGVRHTLYLAVLKVLHFSVLRSSSGQKVRVAMALTNEQADLMVKDEGPPIPNLNCGPFFELLNHDPASVRPVPDMSWDLVVARMTVETMGGSLTAENATPSGCQFHIRLPLSPSEPQ